MTNYVIIADSACDLNEEFRTKYDIQIAPGHIVLPDKSEIIAPLDWKTMGREAFYTDLKKNPTTYATSPANVKEYAALMEAAAEKGEGALVLNLSAGLSGAHGFATQAKKEVLEKYPEAKIEVIDSLRFGPGYGLMAVHAAMLRAEGKTMEETVAYLEENKNRYHQAGWLDDLSFVASKGRLTHAKAFFGTLAGVKPIGEFDYNGLTTVLAKAKGAKAAYEALLTYIEATIENPEEQIIFIAQTNRLPQAEAYKKMIEEKFHPKAVYVNDVFPACGVNVGPGLMAAYYVGKPITKDLAEERAVLEKALQ